MLKAKMSTGRQVKRIEAESAIIGGMDMASELRPIMMGRFGLLEDPTGLIIKVGDRLLECTGVYRAETRSMTMLRTKHFNGETGPDIAAGSALIVPCRF